MRSPRAWLALAAGLALPVVLATAASLALPWLFAAPATAVGGDATQTQIESDLTCQCGCGLTVHSCNHLNCSSAIPLRKEVTAQLALGQSREEVLAYFEKKYGEKILSAPTARGFNIAAWTVPFVVLGLGGLIVGVVLVRWRRSSAQRALAGPAAGVPTTADDPELRKRLERALEDFEERS